MTWKMTLLIFSVSAIAGCGTYEIRPTKPAAPTLNPIKMNEHTCFSRADAIKLGSYLIELEGI